MHQETRKQIQNQMAKFPSEMRAVFSEPALPERIKSVGKKNGIVRPEELDAFVDETMLMILGATHIGTYPESLVRKLGIDDLRADNIASDIKKEILTGIIEKLEKIYAETETDYNTWEDEGEISEEDRRLLGNIASHNDNRIKEGEMPVVETETTSQFAKRLDRIIEITRK